MDLLFKDKEPCFPLRVWAKSTACVSAATALDVKATNGQQSAVMHQPFNQKNSA